ncbi:MAG: hypothetical protein JO247_08395, partial [Chloroflexi bacterium]|nr:hypothetical protein [Chloroflexota bacterium]
MASWTWGGVGGVWVGGAAGVGAAELGGGKPKRGVNGAEARGECRRERGSETGSEWDCERGGQARGLGQ